MSETEDNSDPAEEDTPPRRRGRKRKAAWNTLVVATALFGAFVAAVFLISLLALSGRNVDLPGNIVSQVERQLNQQMIDGSITVGNVSIGLRDHAFRPTLDLENVEVMNQRGEQILALPYLRTKLDTSELLMGRVALETLELDGATLRMRRDLDGALSLGVGSEIGGADAVTGSLADVMASFDGVFLDPALRELEEVSAENIRLELIDERDGQITVIEDGAMSLINGDPVVTASVSFAFTSAGNTPASLILLLEKPKGADGARLRLSFEDIGTRDLARQIGALSWLNLFDAPVSGALSLEIGEEGIVEALAGTLDIDKGVVKPADQAKAVHFNSAKTYVRYESGTQRLYLDGIDLDAPELRLSGDGHADLNDFKAGIPQTLLAQLRLRDIRLAPEGMFETPVTFTSGALDVRYKPADIKLDVGQMVLENEGAQIVLNGSVAVEEEGWAASLDANIGEISADRLLALWPTSTKQNTRNWLTSNIRAGTLQDAAAGLRLVPGKKLDTSVTFNFQDATVSYLKTLPPVSDATGFASITGRKFFLQLEQGHIELDSRGAMDASGSTMKIPDMVTEPVIGRFDLTLTGQVQTALAVLDEKPFEFLSKSDLKPDLASGLAKIDTVLHVPFLKDVKVRDVEYAVSAELQDIRSETLVKDRVLEADRMQLVADGGELSIDGSARLDGVPLNVRWQRDLGPGSGKNSEATGTIELSERTLDVFNVSLPPGSMSGSTEAKFDLTLEPGTPPEAKITSDLSGIALSINALGWTKSAATKGVFALDAELGETPSVREISIEAAGLSAKGTVSLRDGGGLERAVFTPLRVQDRFASNVEIIGRGKGQPAALVVQNGSVDIRKFGVTGGTRGGGPLELALDRVIVTDSITLNDFRGKFRNDRGLDGTFKARLNGQTPVLGAVVPTQKGLAVRIQSQDGGGVLRAANVFRNANGGSMDLILQPTGRPGEFDGRLDISDTRVKKAPALADLLSAVSVVGLLEQLSGDGILFSDVDADFRLTTQGVSLKRSSATGPSMGITMEGIYNTETRRMEMQGVVSPIYMVNGLFGALFSPRRGEGLIGFNYRLLGSADAPRVQVNPLSALTPGIFREIFRRPPPKLSQ